MEPPASGAASLKGDLLSQCAGGEDPIYCLCLQRASHIDNRRHVLAVLKASGVSPEVTYLFPAVLTVHSIT